MSDLTLLVVAAVVIALLTARFFLTRPQMSPRDAFAAVQSGMAVIIDVREPAEWEAGVARDAELLPLSDLRGPRTKWKRALERHRGRKLLVYCHSGMRSAHVAGLLRREGFDAVNIGGFHAWQRAGLPTRRP